MRFSPIGHMEVQPGLRHWLFNSQISLAPFMSAIKVRHGPSPSSRIDVVKDRHNNSHRPEP